ncbi:MAG: cell division protein FtsL [Oscillospiraceae bacterium]
MSASSNLAYDYKRFEEPKKPQISTIKKKQNPKKSAVLAKAVCSMTVVVVMLSALIYTRVVQAELSLDYNAAVKELDALKGENSRLQIRLEQEFSPDSIEAIAREQLNMQKLDNSKIEYIQFDNQERATVIKKQTFFDTAMGWISGLFH